MGVTSDADLAKSASATFRLSVARSLPSDRNRATIRLGRKPGLDCISAKEPGAQIGELVLDHEEQDRSDDRPDLRKNVSVARPHSKPSVPRRCAG